MTQQMIRITLVVVGIVLAGLSVSFFTQQPWAVQVWPWQDKLLAFAFVAAMQAAIAAALFWIAITGELGALAAGALNLLVMMSGLAIYLGGQVAATGRPILLIYTVACIGFAFFNLWLFQWARRIPLRDSRPLPIFVRFSYTIFVIALATVGGALILQTPHVLPWEVEGPTSVALGWMFLGDAFYFLYPLVQFGWQKARWPGAAAQLWSFLAYDLVLLGPFLQRFPKIDPVYRDSLIVYTLILLYSGALAFYCFFINRTTRVIGR
ncbi:MAG: hypothetical protein DYG89_35685 [Caldilinea sp. CFX5]|nr:hypothetical protein [Caldilinea sp. CFX5]